MGGRQLLKIHNNSLFHILLTVYPEFEWLPWKFSFNQQRSWEDVEKQKEFIELAGKELKINELNDWYNVKNKV